MRSTRRTVLTLAVTCAVAVGTIHFPQSISPLIDSGLHVPPDAAALVVTATQAGYTAGSYSIDRFSSSQRPTAGAPGRLITN